MNTMALVGLILIAYGIMVVIMAIKKPAKVWETTKVKLFHKYLGEKGTVIFFWI